MHRGRAIYLHPVCRPCGCTSIMAFPVCSRSTRSLHRWKEATTLCDQWLLEVQGRGPGEAGTGAGGTQARTCERPACESAQREGDVKGMQQTNDTDISPRCMIHTEHYIAGPMPHGIEPHGIEPHGIEPCVSQDPLCGEAHGTRGGRPM